MRRARISVVQTVASLDSRHGGVSRVVPQLADALVDQGCEVCVVTVNGSTGSEEPVLPERANHLGAAALSIGDHRLWSRQFVGQIAKGFGQRMPRVLHDNGLWGYTNYVAARFARRNEFPLIISPHGMLEPWALREKRFRKRVALGLFQRRTLESAAVLMVTADSEFDSVRRAGIKQPVAVIPIGVAMPTSKARHDARATPRKILFLSRIHPKKGLLALVEAWHRVGPQGWHVIVAGPDEEGHLTQVRNLVERLGLRSQFEFHAEMAGNAKRALFESADAFVLPTFSENFGIVVAEAMSYGLPVLTTRGAPWSILPQINAGWWVEPGVEGLAGGLRAVLATTAEQRRAMGDAGRTYVSEHLGWGEAGKKTMDTYNWILGRQPERPSFVRTE